MNTAAELLHDAAHPALAVFRGRAGLARPGAGPESPADKGLRRLWRSGPLLICHRVFTARSLGLDPAPSPRLFDLMELFAFVFPARPVTPTPAGLARSLGLAPPDSAAEAAALLQRACRALLARLEDPAYPRRKHAAAAAQAMQEAGWNWAPAICARLGGDSEPVDFARALPRWEERTAAGRAAPGRGGAAVAVGAEESQSRLEQFLLPTGPARPGQKDYARALARVFAPADRRGEDAHAPRIVLAQAGTGIGKTLGYLAPASLWAARAGAPVWIATYTRNLQRQIAAETARLFPDPAERAKRVVLRKGRENYLCLLNLDQARRTGAQVILTRLIERWALESRDGDLMSGDFPSWLPALAGAGAARYTDRRGECIHAACRYYRNCFVERARARARSADLVIANHALVLSHAARARAAEEKGAGESAHYVFDEGHRLFDAADSAFAIELTGAGAAELRVWILGAGRGRGGLEARIGDVTGEFGPARKALEAVREKAGFLPAPGLAAGDAKERAAGQGQAFFDLLRERILAQAGPGPADYDLEVELDRPDAQLSEAAQAFAQNLADLEEALRALAGALAARLEEDGLPAEMRSRIERAIRAMETHALAQSRDWRAALGQIGGGDEERIARGSLSFTQGAPSGIGLHCHWIDPTRPFAECVLVPAQGAVITSATLCDRAAPGADNTDWQSAEWRTGAQHLPEPARRLSIASPFDYGRVARVLVAADPELDAAPARAARLRDLLLAAGGGGLGLFTAIRSLKAAHRQIAPALAQAGLMLLAQHADGIDTGTLVDMFRAEEDSCLLGTDALRDGMDVPGRALRLIVFDRVPFARPDIVHRARRARFGARRYDDMIVRLRLHQAFGRLIRSERDRGVFVLLDRRFAQRFAPAFPAQIQVERTTAKEAVEIVRRFFGPAGDLGAGP